MTVAAVMPHCQHASSCAACRLQARINDSAAAFADLSHRYATAAQHLTKATSSAANSVPTSWQALLPLSDEDQTEDAAGKRAPAGQQAISAKAHNASRLRNASDMQLCLSMAATYSATTLHCLAQHAPWLRQRERLVVHWAGASVGEADALPMVESCLLHFLPHCKVRGQLKSPQKCVETCGNSKYLIQCRTI